MTRPPEPPHDALIAGLAVQASKLATAAEDLRQTYRFSRQLKVIFAAAGILIVAIGVMLGLLVALANANHENGTVIRDCTTPTGVCYQRGQTATAQAIATIVAQINAHTDFVFLATVECSRQPSTATAFDACIRAKGVRP